MIPLATTVNPVWINVYEILVSLTTLHAVGVLLPPLKKGVRGDLNYAE